MPPPGAGSAGNAFLVWIAAILFGCATFLIGFRLYMIHFRIPDAEILIAINRKEYLRRVLLEMFMLSEIRRARDRARRQTSLPREELGLEETVLNRLPTFRFKQGTHEGVDSQENEEFCMVCLLEFKEGETGRILPECCHYFHAECVDRWFLSHVTCPLCRSEVGNSGDAPPETTPAACPPDGTTAENGPQHALHISDVSEGTDPSETHASGKAPASQPNFDVEVEEKFEKERHGNSVAIEIRDKGDPEAPNRESAK